VKATTAGGGEARTARPVPMVGRGREASPPDVPGDPDSSKPDRRSRHPGHTSTGERGRYAPGSEGPGPDVLRGYGALLSGYAALGAASAWAIRRRHRIVGPLSPLDVVSYAIATQHLSRVLTKDSVTAVVRAPFARFEEAAGEGEVNEEVRGTGLRHAVGELLTCPFCVSQWVATGLITGRILLPQFTTAVVSLSVIARVSDYLQLLYGMAREQQDD
jgi:Protein of unknown function (DUF1360)